MEKLTNTTPIIPKKGMVYIVSAAIHYDDGIVHKHQPKNISSGYVWCGRRHHNIINLRDELLNLTTKRINTAGFLTSDDRFVNRKEAGKIAFECGQIKEDTDCLTSDELY